MQSLDDVVINLIKTTSRYTKFKRLTRSKLYKAKNQISIKVWDVISFIISTFPYLARRKALSTLFLAFGGDHGRQKLFKIKKSITSLILRVISKYNHLHPSRKIYISRHEFYFDDVNMMSIFTLCGGDEIFLQNFAANVYTMTLNSDYKIEIRLGKDTEDFRFAVLKSNLQKIDRSRPV